MQPRLRQLIQVSPQLAKLSRTGACKQGRQIKQPSINWMHSYTQINTFINTSEKLLRKMYVGVLIQLFLTVLCI